ncbi:hypothetical protein ACQKCU_17675 [Heyndrickxia sporothermodurans]
MKKKIGLLILVFSLFTVTSVSAESKETKRGGCIITPSGWICPD